MGASAVFGELGLVTGLELIRREIRIHAIQLTDDVSVCIVEMNHALPVQVANLYYILYIQALHT